MASGKDFVSLRLQSGERFDHIAIQKTEKSLAEFLDQALKQLEVGRESDFMLSYICL